MTSARSDSSSFPGYPVKVSFLYGGNDETGTHIRGKDVLASFLPHGELRVSGRHGGWDYLARSHVCLRHRGCGMMQVGAAAMNLNRCCAEVSWMDGEKM